MTKVEKLEIEVQNLSQTDLEIFREWFRRYNAEGWDQQIDVDVREGRMDELAKEALAEHAIGTSKQI